jgi:hypothetical protein
MPTKIVFIVGAGASCEVGLPSGEGLTKSIASMLNFHFKSGNPKPTDGSSLIAEALRFAGDFNAYLFAARRVAQAMALAASIDSYIHAHEGDKNIELCGKVAVVASILQAERESRLYADLKQGPDVLAPLSVVRGSWFTWCWQLLCEDCTSVQKLGERLETVKFIIFNYDRCVEHFMINAAQQYYSIDRAKAAAVISRIEFFHPYGTVARLPWQSGTGDAFAYGAFEDLNGQGLLKLRQNIKTFNESTDDKDTEIQTLRKTLNEAERLVFLGFAYHRQNMQLLWPTRNPASGLGSRRFYGTALGISKYDVQIIMDEIEQWSGIPYVNGFGEIKNDLKCCELFHAFKQRLSLLPPRA